MVLSSWALAMTTESGESGGMYSFRIKISYPAARRDRIIDYGTQRSAKKESQPFYALSADRESLKGPSENSYFRMGAGQNFCFPVK